MVCMNANRLLSLPLIGMIILNAASGIFAPLLDRFCSLISTSWHNLALSCLEHLCSFTINFIMALQSHNKEILSINVNNPIILNLKLLTCSLSKRLNTKKGVEHEYYCNEALLFLRVLDCQAQVINKPTPL